MILFGIFLVIALISLVMVVVSLKDARKHGWDYVDDASQKKFDEQVAKYNAELQEFKDGKRKKEPKKPPAKPGTVKDGFAGALIALVVFSGLAAYNHPLSAEEQAQVEQQKQVEQQQKQEAAAQKAKEEQAAAEQKQAAEKQKKSDALLTCWKTITDTDNQLMNTVSNPMKATLNGLSDGSVDRYAAYSQFKAQYNSASKIDSDFLGKMKVPDGMDSDDKDKIDQAMQDYSLAIGSYRSAAETLMDSTNKGFTPKAVDDAKTSLQAGNSLKLKAVAAFTEVAQKYGVELPK